jgi:hypothetical protein
LPFLPLAAAMKEKLQICHLVDFYSEIGFSLSIFFFFLKAKKIAQNYRSAIATVKELEIITNLPFLPLIATVKVGFSLSLLYNIR